MERYPSYHPRDYPTGVSEFINTFPPERRREVLDAIIEAHFRGKAEEEWVRRQVQGMLELPDSRIACPCPSVSLGVVYLPRTTP